MKKTLLALLALVTALSFSACGEDKKDEGSSTTGKVTKTDKKPEKKEKSATDEAEETVEGFLKAFCKLDFEAASKYLDDADAMPEELAALDIDAAMKEMMGDLPAEFAGYEDDFSAMAENVIDSMLSKMDYEILDSKEDGDEVIVEVDLTIPDTTAMDSMGDELTSELETLVMDIATKAMENGSLTESSTEAEVMDYLMPKLMDGMEVLMTEYVNDLETSTETIELVVYQDGDDWVISAEDME